MLFNLELDVFSTLKLAITFKLLALLLFNAFWDNEDGEEDEYLVKLLLLW